MKIGIDLYSFDKPGDNFGVGPGVYAWSLLPEIIAQSPNDKFYIFTNSENVDFIPVKSNVRIIIDKLPIKYRFLRIIHEQIIIPFWFLYFRLDFVHFFGNNISYLLANKSILTVLDLMWKFYIDYGVKSLRYKYVGLTIPISIKYAKGIITISEFIANEIADKKLRLRPCCPILLAPGGSVDYDNNNVSEFIKDISQGDFIYSVTTSMPHKNLKILLSAFNVIVKAKRFSGKLIISGQLKGDFKIDTLKFITENKLEKSVILTGFVSESDKNYLYANSLMVVYPSLYEGFGLPVLEAMAFGKPVITSNAASIPEVGGDACLYFNPLSSNELAEKICLVYSDDELRNDLISKGRLQLRKFSWVKTAKETVEFYRIIFKEKAIRDV
jgi:glycosyltransferase involved in cell wall biosynthesis